MQSQPLGEGAGALLPPRGKVVCQEKEESTLNSGKPTLADGGAREGVMPLSSPTYGSESWSMRGTAFLALISISAMQNLTAFLYLHRV